MKFEEFEELARENHFTTVWFELNFWAKELKLKLPKNEGVQERLLEIAWEDIDNLIKENLENWLEDLKP